MVSEELSNAEIEAIAYARLLEAQRAGDLPTPSAFLNSHPEAHWGPAVRVWLEVAASPPSFCRDGIPEGKPGTAEHGSGDAHRSNPARGSCPVSVCLAASTHVNWLAGDHSSAGDSS